MCKVFGVRKKEEIFKCFDKCELNSNLVESKIMFSIQGKQVDATLYAVSRVKPAKTHFYLSLKMLFTYKQ